MSRHYLPSNAAQFDLFVQNMLSYIKNNHHLWKNIPSEAVDKLFKLHNEFSNALRQAKENPTTAYRNARNEAQKALAGAIRAFVNQYLRFDPITNKDRDKMKIPNRDTIRTIRTDVTEEIGFDLKTKGIRQIFVAFRQLGASSTAKPRGYDGAVVVWHIGKERPNSPNDFRYHAVASRTPFIIDFEESERGQTVWVALCWQNGRSIRGKWSAFKSTIVP